MCLFVCFCPTVFSYLNASMIFVESWVYTGLEFLRMMEESVEASKLRLFAKG